jgi:predicted 2-oxoglutarate/Fe(II)-dependent dioxygenase YbiX
MIEVRDKPKVFNNFTELLFVREKFLDPNICDKLIEEHTDKVIPGSSTFNRGTFNKYDLEKNHYIHNHLHDLWEDAIKYFGIQLDFVEPYNIKKYNFGNFYDNHVDNFSSILDRRLSCVVQLSDSKDYGSGDLSIMGTTMTREKGSVIIFPSNFKHKVNTIGFGERWVLITWAWGPAFSRGY